MPTRRPLRLLVPVGGALALAACGVNEGPQSAPTPAQELTEEELEELVLDDAVDLAPGSTMDGSPLVTEDDLPDSTWTDLEGVPAELLDGDDDTLGALACAGGEWPTSVGGVWTCTATLPPERVDTSGAAEGDLLMTTATGAAWVDPETALGAGSCPATGMTIVGDNCVETVTRPTARWMDAVVDCANAGLHLCFHSEIAPGCLSGALTPASGTSGLEWAADRTGNGQAATTFGPVYDCEATADSIGNTREYRCCTPAR